MGLNILVLAQNIIGYLKT